MTNERSSTSERTLVHQRTNARRPLTAGRPFVRGSTSVRSLVDERSFACGRAFVRLWTSLLELIVPSTTNANPHATARRSHRKTKLLASSPLSRNTSSQPTKSETQKASNLFAPETLNCNFAHLPTTVTKQLLLYREPSSLLTCKSRAATSSFSHYQSNT
ncbi:hypothetical protein VIGAN_10095400 [Vigna angularis var. angularis]|uniref:Uncharacterized protein n=1 Tax=Vigna angularis var. angularis TaxID=157739 RepID=A0A0S3T3U2_PHAAN|nr:hypothetical protein VIGAN_10095400 [Vigna angularis var. angularis]